MKRSSREKSFVIVLLASGAALLSSLLGYGAEAEVPSLIRVETPRTATVTPKQVGLLPVTVVPESSGIARSPQFDDVYWTMNDSGGEPEVFAFRRDGTLVRRKGYPVKGARNKDWETLSTDGAGHLVIGDIGNNRNNRKDLTLYFAKEPDPETAESLDVVRTLRFHFPDQTAFPPPPDELHFDCEALFFANGKPYLLSKHRGSQDHTKLYSLDLDSEEADQAAKLLGRFDVGGMVTAAEASPDGSRLAVLTYYGIWLFDAPAGSDRFFEGTVRWLPIIALQCEAICFDDAETLIMTNEQGQVMEVKIASLQVVKKPAPAADSSTSAPEPEQATAK